MTSPLLGFRDTKWAYIAAVSPYRKNVYMIEPSLLINVSPQSLFQEDVGHVIFFAQSADGLPNVTLHMWRLVGEELSSEIKKSWESLSFIWLFVFPFRFEVSYHDTEDGEANKYLQMLSFEDAELKATTKYPELSLKIQVLTLKSCPFKFEL